MVAAAAGEVASAFQTFMSAVCGTEYRRLLTDVLGEAGVARAERQSAYFFADEIRAVSEWRLDAADAARIDGPVLVVQGARSPAAVHRLVSRIAGMLAAARIVTVADDHHLLPLRSPEALAGVVASFVAA